MTYIERIKALRTEVQTMVNNAKTMYADLESKGDKATADERTNLDNLIDAGVEKRIELERLEELEKTETHVNTPAGPRAVRSGISQQAALRPLTWGQKVIQSEQFKRVYELARKGHSVKEMEAVRVRNGDMEVRALYNDDDAQGGHLVREERLTEIFDIARQRPFTLLDVINVSETTSDAVEYIRLISRTNNAAVVPERDGGNFGLKPEGDMSFDLQTAAVKTIAQWVAASRQILQDAPRLRDTIDNELRFQLRFFLENQIIAGDGTGNNFTGILNTAGVQTRVHQTSGRAFEATDTVADTLRRSITDIILEFYEPDGIAMHPTDVETMELDKASDGHYTMVYDPVQMRVWRVPVVENQVLPAGTAITGAWALGATLWDRMQTDIRVGEPNDFFLRNAVAVLAELRAAFAVIRPLTFEVITGLAA